MSEHTTGPALTRPPPARVSRPVVFYLFALILVILIPAMAVALVLLNSTNDAQEKVVQALTNATVQAIGHSVDREVAGMVTTLRVLSSARSLEEGDLVDFHERGVVALAGTGAYLLAVDETFQQLLNTRVAFGTPLGRTSDVAAAQRALDRNMATVSDLFFGETAQAWVFNVWMPGPGRGPARLLALTQNSRNLVPALQSRQLPEGWYAALVDGDNKVIAATPGTGLSIGNILSLRLDTPGTAEEWAEEEVNGAAVVTSEWRSALTGWRIVAWAAAGQVQQPLSTSLLQLAVWGAGIAALASVLAFVIARRIRDSVHGLRFEAQQLGLGEPVEARHYPVLEIAEVSQALAKAAEQRKAAERDVRFLMRELAHRSKNQMAVISAMAKQTARGASDLPSYIKAFELRIMGLARSTDLLLAHGRAGASLRELIELQLSPFRPANGRVALNGPDVRINPQGAQILGMALHELAVNAMKFGAFSDDTGELALAWQVDDGTLRMRWRETLKRDVPPSERAGFGTTVLRTMLGGALDAEVDRTEHADGVEWRIAIPMSALDPAFAAIRPDEGRSEPQGE